MKSMTAMNAKRKQSGFTIIELVVVILLLGILTATALPRFMDVTDEAHTAVVDAIDSGFRTGTALFRAQWTAEGQPDITTEVDDGGFDLYPSALGYPRGDADVLVAGDCAAIYNSLLQDGRPVAASATVANAAAASVKETAIETAATATIDVVAVLEQAAAIDDSVSCTYYYVGQYKEGTVDVPHILPTISYNFETGVITRLNTFELELD